MEAVVLFIFPAILGLVWIYALVLKRQQGEPTVRDEIHRLRNRTTWLNDRLEKARREGWGVDMIAPILDDLADTRSKLARIDGNTPVR